MITDRTFADVQRALEIRRNVIQAGRTPTAEQRAQLARGFMTVDTINRITDGLNFVASTIREWGYYNIPALEKTDWTAEMWFTDVDFQNMAKSAQALRDNYLPMIRTPILPSGKPRYRYDYINAIESIILDMQAVSDEMFGHFRECNTFDCGED